MSTALREAVQQDFDQTLVPGWTHGEETVLQKHITTAQCAGQLIGVMEGGFIVKELLFLCLKYLLNKHFAF